MSPVAVFTHPACIRHDPGPGHPESPARLTTVLERLEEDPRAGMVIAPAGGRFDLLAVHPETHLRHLEQWSASGGGVLSVDTIATAASWPAVLGAIGAVTAAVDHAHQGRGHAFAAVRPPGHHALAQRAMGFCLVNNVMVGARRAQRFGRERVLIVDWDVHHGNGTQDIFYDDDSVTFFSIHRFPFYPGTGTDGETGTGKGLGATVNVPVAFGTSRAVFLDKFQRGLERAAAVAKPDLVLVSAGFDAHASDPVGNLGLQSEDFATLTQRVRQVADTYCQGRLVSCLEGGYNLDALAESVDAHLRTLL